MFEMSRSRLFFSGAWTRHSHYVTFPLFLVLFLGMSSASLWGQGVAGAQISGVVTDPSGAVVPGAEIKAIQTETNTVHDAVSDSKGAYLMPNMPVGAYRITVTAAGFRTYVRTGITLSVGDNVAMNVTLPVGSVQQQVEVAADAAMVETTETSNSEVIDQQRIVDMPLNGREATQLILLSGAATTTPNGDMVSVKNYSGSTTMSVAGGQGNSTNYLMDGGDYNDPWSNVNLPFPFPDALQEFSVENSSLDARYGVHPGAVVNAITKSGTNSFHGNVFEFLRNGAVNARNYFGTAQDTLRRNQFGGTIGGPILRNRLFFFFGYQGTRTSTTPPQTIVFVPTQAALNGNFSTLESASCQSTGKARTLINPATGTAFPNAQIPVSSFNPVALNLLKSVPVSSDPCGAITYGIPNPSSENQELIRIDWSATSKDNIFGRMFIAKYNAPAPALNGNVLFSTQPAAQDSSEPAIVGDTHTFSANVLNSARVTWQRTNIGRGPSPGLPDPNSLGVNMYEATQGFLSLGVTGRFTVGCGSCSPAAFNRSSVSAADDLDLLRGRNHFVFGGEWMRVMLSSTNLSNADGAFTFSGTFTGDSLADFMLGDLSTFTDSNILFGDFRKGYLAAYAQDNVRLNPHFNVTFGARWEPFLAATEIHNHGDVFSPSAFAAGQKSPQFTNSPAGLFFYGDQGIPKGYTNNHYGGFAPRVGFVWDPKGDGKQTVRAGYGLFYDLPPIFFTTGFNGGAPWGDTVTLTSPAGGLSSPFAGAAGGNPFPLPVTPTSTQVFPVAGNYITLPQNLRATTMQQWDLSYSLQLSENWMVSATYLGNISRHIWGSQALNPSVYIPGNCGSAACSTTKNTNQRRVFYLQNPAQGQYYGNIALANDEGAASYHGVIFSAKRRFRGNYTAMVNYTYSHCLSDSDFSAEIGSSATATFENPNNLSADYGNCNFDIRHNFNASVIAATPSFGNRWTQLALSGWRLAPIISWRSGFWFSPLSGLDNSLTGVNLDRPNVSGNPYLRNMSTLYWLNASAFTQNAAGTFGNAGRDSMAGPGAFDLDAAISRSFRTFEKEQLEVRVEAFNAFNHPRFGNPTNTLTSAQFGQILTAADPRILQAAAKYTF